MPGRIDGVQEGSAHASLLEVPDGGSGPIFITKGDDNNVADADPVLAEQIEGKVVFNLQWVGWIPNSVKTAIEWLK